LGDRRFVDSPWVVLSVAVALAIQRHNDRVLNAQVAQSESELRTLGAQIAAIKDRQFGTMSEYVAAYARVEPLLKDTIRSCSSTASYAAQLNREIRNED